MAACYLGLGGNLGEVRHTFQEAVRQLSTAGLEVSACSGLYRTVAVGQRAGSAFLNAAVECHTELDPEQVLNHLLDIERSLGRTREVHWGPRTIDLDLLLFESRILQTPRLTLPHPACWYRRFVLDPLAEIAGQLRHPQRQLTVAQLRDRLRHRPLSVMFVGSDSVRRGELTAEIVGRFSGRIEVKDTEDPARQPVLTFCFPNARGDTLSLESLVPVPDDGDAVGFVLDILQAAVDTPERIAAPNEWSPVGD